MQISLTFSREYIACVCATLQIMLVLLLLEKTTLMSKQLVLPYTVSAITVKYNLKFYSFIPYYPCSARHTHSQPLCCQTVHPRLPGPHQTVNFIVINSNVYALLSQYCLSSLIPTCSPSTVF